MEQENTVSIPQEQNKAILNEPKEKESIDKDEPRCEGCTSNNESKEAPLDGLGIPQMSKKQLKKLRKKQQFEENKKAKRLKERQVKKQKAVQRKALGLSAHEGPSRKELKKNTIESSSNFLQVAVDLDFDDLMDGRALSKLSGQLMRIYTKNRRSPSPCKLYFLGLNRGGQIHSALEKMEGYQNWDVHWHYEPFTEILDKDKVVYLTSDSENVLTELEKDVVYIIGGLIDYNHKKGLCYERAKKLGIRTASLPLKQFVALQSRQVLTTIHVFELLLEVSQGKPWPQAILDTMPARKGVTLKEEQDEGEEGSEGEHS